MDATEDILTADAAHILSLSTERVRQLCQSGDLNPRRTPHGTRIFSRSEVLRLKTRREGKKVETAHER